MSGGDPRIRRLDAGDGELLRRVRLAALADSPGSFADALADDEALAPEEWSERVADGAVFVALPETAGDVPRGMAGARRRDDDPHTISVWGMWVAPAARRGGVGTALIRAVQRWAADEGATRLRLPVMADVPSAVAFYERLGFERRGEERVFRRDRSRRWLEMDQPLRR